MTGSNFERGSSPDDAHLTKDFVNTLLQILNQAAGADRLEEVLSQAVHQLARASQIGQLTVLRAVRGTWHELASSPTRASPPSALISEALDREALTTDADWAAAPLALPTDMLERGARWLIVVRNQQNGSVSQSRPLEDTTRSLAEFLATVVTLVRRQQRTTRHARRLETILRISGRWNRTLTPQELLEQMAEASTRLLDAERATVFLWDRANRMLVGRPALGVENNELRIPDDQGVVGEVIQQGQSLRVDRERGQEHINRDVDEQTGFATETLLCVPLVTPGGRLLGAFEMINKRDGNFSDEDETGLMELAAHAAAALEDSQQYQQLFQARRHIAEEVAQHHRLIGESPAIAELRSQIHRVADTELAVLVLGENGTGKEVACRLIHGLSGRRLEPFIAVNCAALAETLLESELFGHEAGAFTDAHERRVGKFELASGGTLFLDEIGDLSLSGQAQLLRVLEEKVVVRVGGSKAIPVDTRVLAATNQDLPALVRSHQFREDLFFRLNVVQLAVPPLRERGDDVLLLADHFLRQYAAQAHRSVPQLTEAARRQLVAHPWPGNVRELRNFIERLIYLTDDDVLDTEVVELSGTLLRGETSANLPLAEATQHFQRNYIREHIARAGGNVTDAAKALGLHRSNLYRKMRQLGMHDAEEAEQG